MATTVSLPDSLKPLLDQQVERMGYADASAYLSALVCDDAARDPTAHLQALLIEGLESAPEVFDQAAREALLADSEAILAGRTDPHPK